MSTSTGNHDWVGSEFAVDAGVGLVVMTKSSPKDQGLTILDHVKAVFERDWSSRYTKSLWASRNKNWGITFILQADCCPISLNIRATFNKYKYMNVCLTYTLVLIDRKRKEKQNITAGCYRSMHWCLSISQLQTIQWHVMSHSVFIDPVWVEC